jgi:hypothetical protein
MVTSPMTGGPTDDDLDGNDLTTESLRIRVATTGTGKRGRFQRAPRCRSDLTFDRTTG